MPIEEREGFASLTSSQTTELVVAAGLLEAVGGLSGNLSAATATEQLRDLLSPAALWWSGPMAPEQRDQPVLATGEVPRWRAPDQGAIARSAEMVLAACHAALPVPRRQGWTAPVLRVQVSDATTAQQLAELGSVGEYLIVPSIEGRRAREFSWRWPMRIGVARGARSDQWLNTLKHSPYASLYNARIMEPGDPEPFDIAFVEAGVPGNFGVAACVVALGNNTPMKNFESARQWSHAPILIGAASDDIGWFQNAVAEMAHDQPIDVALRIASPTSLIIADTKFLQLTAARQWALAMSGQLRREAAGDVVLRSGSPAKLLLSAGVELPFDSEGRGASEVANVVRRLEQQGYDTALHIRAATAMARPVAAPPPAQAPPEIPPPPAAAGPALSTAEPQPGLGVQERGRRLIADAHSGGRVRRKTLLPETDHDLLVKIAIPSKADTAASIDFPVEHLPSGTSVELMVDVTSVALGLRTRQPIVLSTADRSAPSTTAVFKFRTQAEGSVVDIKILVTYQERPLQEAHYVATVRSQSVTGDRARLNPVHLSSWPEPREQATPADLSLEVNGANLERTSTGRAVDLSYARTRSILDSIEGEASRVLANDAAPESLAEPSAKELLISLARAGYQLRKSLEPLDVANASTISLLVDATTPVFPLELVYDRDPPEDNAELCEHRHGGSMVGKAEICATAGASVVCPYAFWGQQRVIARTIRLDSARKGRAEPAPLALSPVLFAATKRADAETRTNPKPSDDLESQLGTIVGDAKKVARAKSWSDWKRKVEKLRPQLLVLLGHTESAGQGRETLLEIGAESWLKDPDIRAEHLHSKDAPLPLVILLACATAVPRNDFGGLTAAFAGSGAAAVVGTLTKLRGPQGARAAAAVVRALRGNGAAHADKLGAAMTAARHRLLDDGLLVGLLLVAHGEIDLPLTA